MRGARVLSLIAPLAMLALCGCGGKTIESGGLELSISTDLQAGVDFDTLYIDVGQRNEGGGYDDPLGPRRLGVPVPLSLPATFTIIAGKRPDQTVLINVAALLGETPIVLRQVQVTVPTSFVAELPIQLLRDCVGDVTVASDGGWALLCDAGESCQPSSGTCGSTAVDAGALVPYSPDAGGAIVPADAGDATVAPGDAGHDASADATVGADASPPGPADSSVPPFDSSTPALDSGTSSQDSSVLPTNDGSASGCPFDGGIIPLDGAFPDNPCAICIAGTANAGSRGSAANGAICGAAAFCFGGVCTEGCWIGSSSYDAGQHAGWDVCLVCDPQVSVSEWSFAPAGTSCNLPLGFCPGDGGCIGSSCFIGGAVIESGAPAPTNQCAACEPNTSTTAWSPISDVACDAGGDVCASGNCVAGCYYPGYGWQAPDADYPPGNGCQLCDPAVSALAPTHRPDFVTCNTPGNLCYGGQCLPACTIDGGVYGYQEYNPTNACQWCEPLADASSFTTWTNVADGTNSDAGCAWSVGGPACYRGACVIPTRSCPYNTTSLPLCGVLGDDSCCASSEVAEGTFFRTYSYADGGGLEDATAAAVATVSSFQLDKYLVTVGRFRVFANAVMIADGGLAWTPDAGAGMHSYLDGGGLANTAGGLEPGWSPSDNAFIGPVTALACQDGGATWTPTAGVTENLPMNCVTWAEAYAFCIWDKGFLPSAAELEYAAAGGPLQYEYPWGEADPGTGDGFAIYDTNGTLAGLTYPGTIGTVTGIAPVGTATLGVGPFGQLDLAGEVWEWALDWTAAYTEPCVNCATTTGGGTRARHGGSFSAGPSSLQVSYFSGAPPTERTPVNGFRCARAP